MINPNIQNKTIVTITERLELRDSAKSIFYKATTDDGYKLESLLTTKQFNPGDKVHAWIGFSIMQDCYIIKELTKRVNRNLGGLK